MSVQHPSSDKGSECDHHEEERSLEDRELIELSRAWFSQHLSEPHPSHHEGSNDQSSRKQQKPSKTQLLMPLASTWEAVNSTVSTAKSSLEAFGRNFKHAWNLTDLEDDIRSIPSRPSSRRSSRSSSPFSTPRDRSGSHDDEKHDEPEKDPFVQFLITC
mmetsp:Transcript_68114/g.181978  ORF Transcript_68114/g.181978 Transcript_68114/m.181978 type:complete len:159 (+) Transcript_68114:73-549(+)